MGTGLYKKFVLEAASVTSVEVITLNLSHLSEFYGTGLSNSLD